MIISQEIIEAYFEAKDNDSYNRDGYYMKKFKELYPKEYYFLNSHFRLRTEMNRDTKIMAKLGLLHWFTLTFNNEKDSCLITTKRKQATSFLNDLFISYEMVEEYGSENERYHIHGFGVFREGKGFDDFRQWHSRQKIEEITDEKIRSKIKYLTKYAVKDLPRIRRSKSLCYLVNHYKRTNSLDKVGFTTCASCQFNIHLLKVKFGVYNKGAKSQSSFQSNQ